MTIRLILRYRCSLGISLAPVFVADFPPYAHKFNQRTFHVRLINLCTSDKKSSHKTRHKEIPREHIENMEEALKKVIVIGGGAAGMMAAISSAECGNQVTLIEHNEKLGKKVFITGKGRCNVTNAGDIEDIMNNIVTNKKFMYSSLYSFSNYMMMDLLEKNGLKLKVERGNRVFPESDKSSDVIRTLEKILRSKNVEIILRKHVDNIIIKDGQVCGVSIGQKHMACDKVILATGGISYQSTGSDGSGLRIAGKCGHNVVECLPALVPLTVKEDYAGKMQGVSLKNISIKMLDGKKEIYSAFGEMLFTHFGVTGPVILSASSVITKKLHSGKSIALEIDLKPALTEEKLDARILREFEKNINRDFKNSLDSLLPKKMIPVIIEYCGIDGDKKINTISKEERKRLLDAFKHFRLTVEGTRDFNEAIITQGGVSVKDINPGTMESKKVKGLYFAGEMIDIDAFTGGYNLQLAWSTGYLAGMED